MFKIILLVTLLTYYKVNCIETQNIDLVQYQNALDSISKGKIQVFKHNQLIKLSDVWVPTGQKFYNCDFKVSDKFFVLYCKDGTTILWRISNLI